MSGTNEMHPGLNRFQQAIYGLVPEHVKEWMNNRTTASEMQDHHNSPTSVEATFREWDAFDRQNQRATLDERQAFHAATIDRAFQEWNQERATSAFETVYLPENAVDRSAEYLPPLSNSDEATKATQSWNTDLGQSYMAEMAEREYRGSTVASITEHPNYPTISQEVRDTAWATSVGLTNDDPSVLQFHQMERDRVNDGGLEK